MYASADGQNASAGALAKKSLLSYEEWIRFVKVLGRGDICRGGIGDTG
jgi:hypothetical protein